MLVRPLEDIAPPSHVLQEEVTDYRPRHSISRSSDGVRDYLEAATREIIEAANNGTWRQVASRYYAIYCGGFHDMDTDLWIDMKTSGGAVTQIEDYLKANPKFHSVVEDITVHVNERSDRATVWMVRTDSGLADGLRRESVLRMCWVRTDSGWLCVDSSGIRHFPFYLAHGILQGGGM